MKQKYVITTDGYPILFPQMLIHRHVSQQYSVISAGFFSTRVDNEAKQIIVKCWGESNSLHIRSRPLIDAKILEAFLNE